MTIYLGSRHRQTSGDEKEKIKIISDERENFLKPYSAAEISSKGITPRMPSL